MKPSSTDTQSIEADIQAGESTAEQAADLAALRAAAVPEAVPGQAVEEQTGPDLAGELAAGVTIFVGILGPIYPSLRSIYTPDATAAAAGAVAAVCNKHGWLQGGMMGKWGEEIACLAVVGPLAFATVQGIKADTEARQEKKQPATEPGALLDLTEPSASTSSQAPGAGQKTVTFGGGAPA